MKPILIALALAAIGDPVVKTSEERTTRVYVRTIPTGAAIKVDGQPQGKSDALFTVPPGVEKMTIEVELDGHLPQRQEVQIRGGRITRVELIMQKRPEEPPKPQAEVPKDAGSRQPGRLDFRVAPIALNTTVSPRASNDALVIMVDRANWPLHDKPGASPGGTVDNRFVFFPCEPSSLPLRPDVIKFHGWPGVPLPDAQNRVLLCNQPDDVMLASDPGDRRWGLRQVTVVSRERGQHAISIELDKAGARRIGALTSSHLGKPLAILVNDRVIAMPVIRSKLGATAEIAGNFTEDEADRLADSLRAGIRERAAAARASGETIAQADAYVTIGKPGTAPPIVLGYVGDSNKKGRSFADSGHAVLFSRPSEAKAVVAVQLFCSRYGLPQAPKEDFHVYLLDQNQKVLRDVPVPYAKVERGEMRWYSFECPRTPVPERFYVAVAFSAHETKGIYLGLDDVKESHSYSGLPESGFEKRVEKSDWMIRVLLSAK
jgi:hypothetical protein